MADERDQDPPFARGRLDSLGYIPATAASPVAHIPYEIHIKQVNGNRGYIVTVGCKTFVFETWLAMATALGEYQENPTKVEREFGKKYEWDLDGPAQPGRPNDRGVGVSAMRYAPLDIPMSDPLGHPSGGTSPAR